MPEVACEKVSDRAMSSECDAAAEARAEEGEGEEEALFSLLPTPLFKNIRAPLLGERAELLQLAYSHGKSHAKASGSVRTALAQAEICLFWFFEFFSF